jgi:tetratricopeptide (TPR) repeat protein
MSESMEEQIERLYEQVTLLYEQGHYQAAIDIAITVRDLTRQHLGEQSTEFAASLNNLALFYKVTDQYAAAEPLYRQALEVYHVSAGEDSCEVATSLNNLAALYLAMGRVQLARPLFEQAQELVRAIYGDTSAEFGASLNNLAAAYEILGDYRAAERLFRQSLELTRAVFGDQNVEVASSLNNLAAICEALGKYSEAETLFQQSLALYDSILPPGHPYIATTLTNFGRVYQALGKHHEAEKLYRRALDMQRAASGDDSPDVATLLQSLAELQQAQGNYQEAERLYRQALDIRQRTLGQQHPTVATSLGSLAGLYQQIGDYENALSIYQQALDIRRTTLGDNHPETATTLHDLGMLHVAMGDYAIALPLYEQALTIRRTVLGNSHPRVAGSLDSMAELQQAAGNYAVALPLYQQALDIRRTTFGEQHLLVAVSLNNLALLHYWTGDYAAALPLLEQAADIRRRALGPDHPDVAQSLHNLAAVFRVTQQYAAAERLQQQAIAIYRKTLGESHAAFAASLSNLASLYEAQGNYAAAEPLLQQAVKIFRQASGDQHPDVAATLHNLANLLVATGKIDAAVALFEQATAINDRMIDQIFSIGSESQRMAYLADIQAHFNVFLSLALQHPAPALVRTAFNLVLRRKGIGAEALATQRDLVLGGRYPNLVPKVHALAALRMQIAQATLAGPGSEESASYRQRLLESNQQKEQMEAELARLIPEISFQRQLRGIDSQEIVRTLPRGAALVEFVRFQVFDFSAVLARGEPRWKPARYIAFIVYADAPEQIDLIDLKEAAPIDQLITRFRRSMVGADAGRELIPAVKQAQPDDAGEYLRNAVFDPLMAYLGERTQLFLAPDGDLTRLPFEVLPTEDRQYLIDHYQISYLSTSRDIQRLNATLALPPAAPLVVADPEFDLSSHAAHPTAENDQPRGRQSRDLDRSMGHFQRLPGTRIEAEQIAAKLGVQPLLQQDVLEAALKACRAPHILHIATHGFFLPNQQLDPAVALLMPQAAAIGTPANRIEALQNLENPLLRSGLALAGANTWLQHGQLPAAAEDGILTAEDVAGLDLLGTELVVLSACETGLGEVLVGEGVFGLRRAFVLAGAKTLVMSLWKVPDSQTQELMVDFYQRILNGQSRAEALRKAQLALKERYPHPWYWGAFICQGDPGPLSQIKEDGAQAS